MSATETTRLDSVTLRTGVVEDLLLANECATALDMMRYREGGGVVWRDDYARLANLRDALRAAAQAKSDVALGMERAAAEQARAEAAKSLRPAPSPFCYQPERCAGLACCPKSPACTE